MNDSVISLARQVISVEVEGLIGMSNRLDDSLANVVELLLACRGRVIVIGMGKSGIVGRKIAATFASTGTPSFFVHPGEAFHGDLGMITAADVVLMISNSGETEELVRLLPFLEYQGNRVIAMTGAPDSILGRHGHAVLDVSVEREACNNNLAPTSSTTATLVMGDVLAVVLSTLRDFKPEDFARFHPGGRLGRRLLTKVRDVMRSSSLPQCAPETPFRDVVAEISRGRLGIVLVVTGGALVGVITDGDLRRTLQKHHDFSAVTAGDMMTAAPQVIAPDERFIVAEELMRRRNISNLVVVDGERRPLGVLQIYAA